MTINFASLLIFNKCCFLNVHKEECLGIHGSILHTTLGHPTKCLLIGQVFRVFCQPKVEMSGLSFLYLRFSTL